jgi:hypothetical protein
VPGGADPLLRVGAATAALSGWSEMARLHEDSLQVDQGSGWSRSAGRSIKSSTTAERWTKPTGSSSVEPAALALVICFVVEGTTTSAPRVGGGDRHRRCASVVEDERKPASRATDAVAGAPMILSSGSLGVAHPTTQGGAAASPRTWSE